MNNDELETLLRAGPADEPRVVRSLVLPPAPVGVVRRGAPERHGHWVARRAVAAGLVGLAVVAIGLGVALRLAPSQLWSGFGRTSVETLPLRVTPSPSALGTAPTGGSFSLGVAQQILSGITVRVPVGWQMVTVDQDIKGPRVALANFLVQTICGEMATSACLDGHRLTSGEILVTISNDDNAHTLSEVMPATGPDALIGGMPAVVQVVENPPGTSITGVEAPPGCDAHRAWWIARPTSKTGWLAVDACSARADRVEFESIVDGLARSIEFSTTASAPPTITP